MSRAKSNQDSPARPLTSTELDAIDRGLAHHVELGALVGVSRDLEMGALLGLRQLRAREAQLLKLVGKLRAALPSDKRSYRGLKARVEQVLAPPIEMSPAEMRDFEEWHFYQSNVMHDMGFPAQYKAWLQDADWKNRSEEKPYRSKA